MSWFFTALSLAGVLLNIYKNKYCFVIWSCTNLYWCVFDFTHGLHSQSFLFLIYFILAIHGLIVWKKSENKT